jgi:hypothetical protein
LENYDHDVLDENGLVQSLRISRNTVDMLVLWQMLKNVRFWVICAHIIISFQLQLIVNMWGKIGKKSTNQWFSQQPRNIPLN